MRMNSSTNAISVATMVAVRRVGPARHLSRLMTPAPRSLRRLPATPARSCAGPLRCLPPPASRARARRPDRARCGGSRPAAGRRSGRLALGPVAMRHSAWRSTILVDARADVVDARLGADSGEQRARHVSTWTKSRDCRPSPRTTVSSPAPSGRGRSRSRRPRASSVAGAARRRCRASAARRARSRTGGSTSRGTPRRRAWVPYGDMGRRGSSSRAGRSALAVDGAAGRREDDLGVARRLEHAQQADDVDLGVEGRPLDRGDDVGLCREMEDRVSASISNGSPDVVLHEAGRGVDVLPSSGRQVVGGHLVVARDERVDDVQPMNPHLRVTTACGCIL